MRRHSGFTLIELMIVVAIVAILAAVALPSYSYYIRRGKVMDAVSGLSDMRLRVEQFFQDHRTYAGACTAPATSPHFAFTCPTANATQFTIVATGQNDMVGYVYSIDQDTNRTTTAFPGVGGLPKSCWVLKKDGSC